MAEEGNERTHTWQEATIMDNPQLLAVWLHTLAFVIAWGYYGVLAAWRSQPWIDPSTEGRRQQRLSP